MPATSCKLLLVILLAFLPASCALKGPAAPAPVAKEALPDPTSQIEQWQRDLARDEASLPGAGFERGNLLIRLARTSWQLVELLPKERQQPYRDKGQHYAQLLMQEQPGWVDGYYWSSMNLCSTAENCGAGNALRMLPEIVQRLERAAAIDPTYDQAGPHRVLGRIFFLAPAWPLSVGDLGKALEHLRLAVKIAPQNSTNQLFLGEALLHLEKKAEARKALEAVLSCTEHAVWPQGVIKDRQKAENLLKKLK